jgi:hypothetical protein
MIRLFGLWKFRNLCKGMAWRRFGGVFMASVCMLLERSRHTSGQ